jgi:hypothetical protein
MADVHTAAVKSESESGSESVIAKPLLDHVDDCHWLNAHLLES